MIALDCTPIALEDAPLEDAGRANRGGQADHGSKQDPGREVGRRGSLLQDLDRTPGGLRTPALPDVDVHNTDDMHDDAALNEEVAQALGRYEERVYGRALPLIAEWRETRLRRGRVAHTLGLWER